jgi:hypothetical protein
MPWDGAIFGFDRVPADRHHIDDLAVSSSCLDTFGQPSLTSPSSQIKVLR